MRRQYFVELGCRSTRDNNERTGQGASTQRARSGNAWAVAVNAAMSALLAACSQGAGIQSSFDSRTGVSASPRVIADGRPVPKGGGVYKVGNPYQVSGRWYFPGEQAAYDEVGVGSWYGEDFHGRRTANGEIFDMTALTAAHKTLPLPSYAWVTNLSNGRTILVRVNDRGPYAQDRIIDLSRQSARTLGSEGSGLARVRVRYAGPAPLDGNDYRERQHLAEQSWWHGAGQVARLAQYDQPWLQQRAPVPLSRHTKAQGLGADAIGAGGSREGWTAFSYRADLSGAR